MALRHRGGKPMADHDFVSWAREQIGRFRAQADALETAVNLFLAAEASKQLAATDFPEGKAAPTKTTRFIFPSRPRGAKTGAILKFIEEAGDRGATLADVYQMVAEQGLDMQKSSV